MCVIAIVTILSLIRSRLPLTMNDDFFSLRSQKESIDATSFNGVNGVDFFVCIC